MRGPNGCAVVLAFVLVIVTIAAMSTSAAAQRPSSVAPDNQLSVTVSEAMVIQAQNAFQTDEIVWSRSESTADVVWSKRDIPWWRLQETNIIRCAGPQQFA